jgi:putative ABC transport system permease protein
VVESATLATVGAVLGVVTGILAAMVFSALTSFPASVAPWSIVVGVILGGGVGIASGVYPASRAARLDPIAALRQE